MSIRALGKRQTKDHEMGGGKGKPKKE